ncbi:MAG: glycosyl transferase family 1 [Phycisphaera sp.]|nr:glycosyl transferase family 1 [Phycisphaera sp.]
MTRRLRILFFAEAVTLAHVARPLTLARSLDPERFEVHFAWSPRFQNALGPIPLSEHAIDSIPSQQFIESLTRGNPLYDAGTLRAYIQDDLRVIEHVRPDAVVGDLRLSLSVSARMAGVPYLNFINAYWSPYARQRYVIPDHPMEHVIGTPAAQAIFRAIRPFAFALHAKPLNTVRAEHGLPTLGQDLRRVYTDGDHVLYGDVPEIAPTHDLPPNHHYLGPVPWSPSADAECDKVLEGLLKQASPEPIIYATLGSSGRGDALDKLIEATRGMGVRLIAAKAGKPVHATGDHVHLWDYLPGDRVCSAASLAVNNGGSPGAYQALSAGVPVLGVCSNMDQHLNMANIRATGAGQSLRAGTLKVHRLHEMVDDMLKDAGYRQRAQGLAKVLARYDAPARLAGILESVIGGTGGGETDDLPHRKTQPLFRGQPQDGRARA